MTGEHETQGYWEWGAAKLLLIDTAQSVGHQKITPSRSWACISLRRFSVMLSAFFVTQFLRIWTVKRTILFNYLEANCNLILNPYLKAFFHPPVWFTNRTLIRNALWQSISVSRQKLEKKNIYNLFIRRKFWLNQFFPYEIQNCIVKFLKFKS